MAALQRSLTGDDTNVIGIVGRGFTPEITKLAVGADGRTDWRKAWQLFNQNQWIEDIEDVRKAVVGAKGTVLLYGASGGASLVHHYLLHHGDFVTRAYTESPGNSFMNGELGITSDHFWSEIGESDPTLRPLLLQALAKHPAQRLRILLTIQRQHFFVTDDSLPDARATLIRALAGGDDTVLEAAAKEYQVDPIIDYFTSAAGAAIAVREFELIYPTGGFDAVSDATVHPYIEAMLHFTKPLVELARAGAIAMPPNDFTAAHRLDTEVFLMVSRWDEAADYRTAIALAYSYPRHALFIADDNHVFAKLTKSGLRQRFPRTFLSHGLNSAELRALLSQAKPYRWREQ